MFHTRVLRAAYPSWARVAPILLVLGIACATFLGAPRDAHAQPTPDEMRPMVFVLLDTSGSMEWLTDYTGGFDPVHPETGLPDCASATPERNRWLVTMETLTGSFEGLSCTLDFRLDPARQEDVGYPIPHVAWAWTGQKSDGLLDLLQDDIAFGLMTFDAHAGASSGSGGGYSYFDGGPDGLLGTLPVDLGIKNESAPGGGLVHPSNDDTLAGLRLVNEEVQSQILPVIPYGGTPTGMALHDIATYLGIEPRMQLRTGANPLGDPFANCRKKSVVLITDGRPTPENRYGYGTTAAAAARLFNQFGVKTYVVGFALEETVRVQDCDADGLLDGIDYCALLALAQAGGTERPLLARNQTQLVGTLSAVLGEIQAGVDSRTRPVITNTTRNEPEDKQYRFWSARASISGDPVDREGVVEWETWACRAECRSETNDSGVDLCAIDDLNQFLVAQSTADSRSLHTVVTDPAAGGPFRVEPLVAGNPALTPTTLQVPVEADYPQVALFDDGTGLVMPFGHVVFELPDGTSDPTRTGAEKRTEYVRQLIDFVRATPTSRRANHPLGGVYRGTPALQTAPPRWVAPTPSFQFYASENINRPNVLYVPTHDGVLHAFRVDRGAEIDTITSTSPGQELWGFMPGFALKRLHVLGDSFTQLLDGPPNVAEVLPLRDAADADPTDEALQWMTVAIVPAGTSGRGIFALDVTDPVQWRDTMFLWEITPEGRCVGPSPGTCTASTNGPGDDFSKLGYTLARPAIGTLFTTVGLAPKERTVAFVAGGDDPDNEGIGRVFYILDVETGKKVVEFSDAAGNVFGGPTGAVLDDYPLVGTPVAYSSAVGQFVTRVFVGDAGGRMWRISIDSPNPADWRMDLFHDAFAGLPVGHALRAPIWDPPTVASSRFRGRLVVVYTAGNLDQRGTEPLHTIYSLLERRVDATTVVAEENWRYDFPAGEQPVGPPLIFNKAAYYTSYIAPADLCDIGTARVWGVDYMETDTSGNLLPRMDGDGDPLTLDFELYRDFGNAIPLGVRIVREPSCVFTLDFGDAFASLPPGMFEGADGGAPGGGAPGLGGMRLVMQKGGAPTTDGQAQPPAATTGNVQESRIAKEDGIPIAMPANQVVIESWATIFD